MWSAIAFVQFRMRIYSAWMIAESICIVAGIGVYPESSCPESGIGPKNLSEAFKNTDELVKYSAECVNNLDIPKIEHSDGFRSGMRAWNRSVQFWLANFVYKRSSKSIRLDKKFYILEVRNTFFTFRNFSKFLRLSYTMFVSAFWHGIKPGYFLSFLTIPLCTFAEDILFKAFPIDRRPTWVGTL